MLFVGGSLDIQKHPFIDRPWQMKSLLLGPWAASMSVPVTTSVMCSSGQNQESWWRSLGNVDWPSHFVYLVFWLFHSERFLVVSTWDRKIFTLRAYSHVHLHAALPDLFISDLFLLFPGLGPADRPFATAQEFVYVLALVHFSFHQNWRSSVLALPIQKIFPLGYF